MSNEDIKNSDDIGIISRTPHLPPFWNDKPALWFAAVEAQFSKYKITSESTKYDYIISVLNSDTASEIEDIIINPPAPTQAYTVLKQTLIKRLSISLYKRVQKILVHEELGDRTPTQFLRHLQSLLGPLQVQDDFLTSMWLQRMPVNVQQILQGQSTLPLSDLASLADKIMEVAATPLVASTQIHEDLAKRVNDLTNRLDHLTDLIKKSTTSERAGYSRTRYRSRSPSTPRKQYNQQGNLCWYHTQFGKRAKRCKSPCTFSKNN
uniref:DUF7041 domain-containing protein n=1 Tax=Xenopsylla cheopis TaxID=163159 RepID=A0A6M2DQP9_XENCH